MTSVTCPTVDTVEVLRVVGALVISGQLLLVARLLRVMLWMVRVLYLMNLLRMVCGRSEDCSQLLAYSFLILTMNEFTWRLPPRLDFQAELPVLKQYYNFENDIWFLWSILTLFLSCSSFQMVNQFANWSRAYYKHGREDCWRRYLPNWLDIAIRQGKKHLRRQELIGIITRDRLFSLKGSWCHK